MQVEELALSFPEFEKFELINQIIRAARSISANIAEGYGRFHFKESIQFYRIADGSLFELLDHLYVAKDNGYISQETFIMYQDQVYILNRQINGFIAHTKKCIKKYI